MRLRQATPRITVRQLAHIGEGEVGYIRPIKGEDVIRCFPEWSDIDPSMELWALFAADGRPILVTDNRSSTFYKAAEDELKTVSLH
jgi:hypothetical protein